MRKSILIIIPVIILISCGGNKNKPAQNIKDTLKQIKIVAKEPLSDIEKQCIRFGLVDVHKLDTNIAVDLKYSTKDNLMGYDVYGDFSKAYLQEDVAKKLVCAQKYLAELKPGYRLIVYDAARPLSVQQEMWDSVKLPEYEKLKYIANPKIGSLHNYGCAVDISIIDNNSKALDMGSPFDFLGKVSFPQKEDELLKLGKLSQEQVYNHRLLRKVMKIAGFSSTLTEWWHFNSCSLQTAKSKYKIIM